MDAFNSHCRVRTSDSRWKGGKAASFHTAYPTEITVAYFYGSEFGTFFEIRFRRTLTYNFSITPEAPSATIASVVELFLFFMISVSRAVV